jgi:hypothetical protein
MLAVGQRGTSGEVAVQGPPRCARLAPLEIAQRGLLDHRTRAEST